MSHTPGPWITSAGHVFTTDNRPIAECRTDWAHNAPLIAAAPDLLEALKAACRLYAIEYGKEADDWRAAIAKAEGK